MASQPPVDTSPQVDTSPAPAPSPAPEPQAPPQIDNALTWETQTDDEVSAMVAEVFGIDPASVGTGEVGAGGQAPQQPTPLAPTDGGSPHRPPQPSSPQPVPTGTPPAPAQPTAPLSPEAQAVELASLRARLAAAETEVQQMRLGVAPPAAPTGQPEQPGPVGPGGLQVEPIPVQLPPEIVGAILGEDQNAAVAALNHTVSLIATGLNHRFRVGLEGLRNEVAAHLGERMVEEDNQRLSEQAAAHRADYFSAFPSHNKPIFQSIIAQEASLLAAQHPGVPWDINFRNALGQRVNAVLAENGWTGLNGGAPNGGGPALGDPQPLVATESRREQLERQARQQQQPAAFLPSGARPAPDDPNSEENLVLSTLAFPL